MNVPVTDHRLRITPAPILAIMAALLLCVQSAVYAQGKQDPSAANPVKPIAEITVDDSGDALRSPSTIFFDRTAEELYVIAGSDRVVVYSNDYFPLTSIGAGRGVAAPQGVYVDRTGLIYICQGRTAAKPARITIFNAAFFPIREITIDSIEEARNFSPRRLAVGRDGTLYVAGYGRRGLLVLAADGRFLRWLRPVDRILDKEAIAEETERKRMEEESRLKVLAAKSADPGEEPLDSSRPLFEVPEEFRPKGKGGQEREDEGPGMGAVQVTQVIADAEGHLYLLSEETSKVYVYSADETFLFSFGEKGGVSGKMSRPRGLAIDEKRKVAYLVDYMRHTILVYDLAGRFVHEFGGMGRGPGWFNYPSDVALNRQGQLLVADLFNQRVQVLDVDFKMSFPLFIPRSAAPPTDRIEEEELQLQEPGDRGQETEELGNGANMQSVIKSKMGTLIAR